MQQVIGSIYQVTDTIVTSKGALLDYQYYVYRDGQTVRENVLQLHVQRCIHQRGGAAPGSRSRQLARPSRCIDTATSVTQDRRQPQFPNGRRLAQNVLVTWTVDLRPAIYQAMAGRHAE